VWHVGSMSMEVIEAGPGGVSIAEIRVAISRSRRAVSGELHDAKLSESNDARRRRGAGGRPDANGSVIMIRTLGSQDADAHVKSAIELSSGRPGGADPSVKVARQNVWVKVYAEDPTDAIEGSRRVSDTVKKGPAPAYSPDVKINRAIAVPF
jgi:hypothetical protein